MLQLDQDSCNGAGHHFCVDGRDTIHVVGVVLKSSISDINLSISNHISSDFLSHFRPDDISLVDSISYFLCRKGFFLLLGSGLGTAKMSY